MTPDVDRTVVNNVLWALSCARQQALLDENGVVYQLSQVEYDQFGDFPGSWGKPVALDDGDPKVTVYVPTDKDHHETTSFNVSEVVAVKDVSPEDMDTQWTIIIRRGKRLEWTQIGHEPTLFVLPPY